MTAFALEKHADPDAQSELVAKGELDISAVPALDAALQQTRSAGSDVTLDLSRITFIDICAARSVLRAARAASLAGQTLTIVSPSPPVGRVLELMGAEDFAAVGPAEQTATRR